MILAPNDLLNLLAVRSLRDFAAAQTRAPDAVHRQMAVVLLDAAIERAVFTACDFKQVSLKESARLEDALGGLSKIGWVPEPGLENDRKRLHRARNGAQHAGLDVPAASVPSWVTTAHRFIDHLLHWAYGVNLDEVRYSAAIRGEGIREALDRAEAALAANDHQGAMLGVHEAFRLSNAIWSKFVESTNTHLRQRTPSYYAGIGLHGGDDQKVLALKEIATVSAISPEPAEALWYLETRPSQHLLNEDEVRRALVFVFGFAVAVEASPAGQVPDRIRRKNVAARRVRLNFDSSASIASFRYRVRGSEITVVLHLKDVPDEDRYDKWARAVGRLLQTDAAVAAQTYLEQDGTLIFSPSEGDIDALVDEIEAALASAETRMREQDLLETNEGQRVQEERVKLEGMLNAATPQDLPAWLSFSVEEAPFGDGKPQIVAHLDHPAFNRGNQEELANAIRNAIAADTWTYSRGWVLATEPAAIPTVVTSLNETLQPLIIEWESARKNDDERARSIVSALVRRGYPESDAR